MMGSTECEDYCDAVRGLVADTDSNNLENWPNWKKMSEVHFILFVKLISYFDAF